MRTLVAVPVAGLFVLLSVGLYHQQQHSIISPLQSRRSLLDSSLDIRSILAKPKVYEHSEWCRASTEPPLDFWNCDPLHENITAVPLYGGLTNGLKFILLASIYSAEHNQCLFIDESKSVFPKHGGPFLEKFFEPIGIPPHHELVMRAHEETRVKFRFWPELWDIKHNRRVQNQIYNNTSWEQQQQQHHPASSMMMEGHDLKRYFLKRIWRPLPHVREAACIRMERLLNGSQDYIAFSIRQGDKTSEGMAFATMQQYIDKAEEILGADRPSMPLVFVATDECKAIPELQALRPTWTFVSACDFDQDKNEHGYDVFENAKWSSDEIQQHYSKFFVELFAMASAKIFIGVWYTNVSWWVYFMRPTGDDFHLLETPGMNHLVPSTW